MAPLRNSRSGIPLKPLFAGPRSTTQFLSSSLFFFVFLLSRQPLPTAASGALGSLWERLPELSRHGLEHALVAMRETAFM